MAKVFSSHFISVDLIFYLWLVVLIGRRRCRIEMRDGAAVAIIEEQNPHADLAADGGQEQQAEQGDDEFSACGPAGGDDEHRR